MPFNDLPIDQPTVQRSPYRSTCRSTDYLSINLPSNGAPHLAGRGLTWWRPRCTIAAHTGPSGPPQHHLSTPSTMQQTTVDRLVGPPIPPVVPLLLKGVTDRAANRPEWPARRDFQRREGGMGLKSKGRGSDRGTHTQRASNFSDFGGISCQ